MDTRIYHRFLPLPRRSFRAVLFFASLALFAAVAPPRPSVASDPETPGTSRQRAAVEQLLQEQSTAWSAGDLATFCSFYSSDSIFVSPTGVTRGGPAQIHDRYRKRYSTAREMGQLTLDVEDYQPIGKTGASIVARWTLRYPDDPSREEASGMTLLVILKEGGNWVISRDASM